MQQGSIDRSIERARERLFEALAAVQRVEDGERVYSALGGEPLRDITSEYRHDKEQTIEDAKELLRLYEQDDA